MKTIDLRPTQAGLKAMFRSHGIGACPRCNDYGPHAEQISDNQERRCRKCRRVFYLDEIPYIARGDG